MGHNCNMRCKDYTLWTIPQKQSSNTVSVRVGFGHQMRVGFCLWAIELTRVVRKTPHFGIGIAWGAITMSFSVFWISVSGRSLNSYGTSPNLWVQKELVKFRQCTQDMWLRFAKFLREFLGYPPSISSETWEMYSWVNSGSSTFCRLLPLLPSGVSFETGANFLLFLNLAIFLEENLVSDEDWI